MTEMLSFQALSGWGGIIIPHIYWIEKLFWVIRDLLWWLNMSLSCLSDRDLIETQVFGLMNWTKSSLEWSIQLVRIKCVWEREKNGVTSSVGAWKVFLRLRCFARHTRTHTHTHLSELSLSPSHDDLWQRDSSCPVNMPGNRHSNILNTTTGSSSCCRLQWQLLLSLYAPESLPHCC